MSGRDLIAEDQAVRVQLEQLGQQETESRSSGRQPSRIEEPPFPEQQIAAAHWNEETTSFDTVEPLGPSGTATPPLDSLCGGDNTVPLASDPDLSRQVQNVSGEPRTFEAPATPTHLPPSTDHSASEEATV